MLNKNAIILFSKIHNNSNRLDISKTKQRIKNAEKGLIFIHLTSVLSKNYQIFKFNGKEWNKFV